MITAQTAKLIAMQIKRRRLEEVRASWFFLLILTISNSVTCYSFRQGMGKQLGNLIRKCKRCATTEFDKS
jgi:hypothetical protein